MCEALILKWDNPFVHPIELFNFIEPFSAKSPVAVLRSPPPLGDADHTRHFAVSQGNAGMRG